MNALLRTQSACTLKQNLVAALNLTPRTPMVRAHAQSAESDHKTYQIKKNCKLHLQIGDITKWSGDAIVNAANERMLGGGGVDGAIHRAAGPELLQACKETPEVKPGIRCPTGEARLTKGFNLPAKYVIHTVGPVFQGHKESGPALYNAYKSCLDICEEHGLKSIAFPAISCGVYGYPLKDAASTAFKACSESNSTVEDIHFVLFSSDTYAVFAEGAENAGYPDV